MVILLMGCATGLAHATQRGWWYRRSVWTRGDIAVHVSSFLRRADVRDVLPGACWERSDDPQLRLTGRVFAMYETTPRAQAGCVSGR